MPLNLMYITNNPEVAAVAEKYGVDRVWVDLETLGKEERQKHVNSVKSRHTIQDIERLSKVLSKSELMVRVNPWHGESFNEINSAISAGAQRLMLPMWKSFDEVDAFLQTVNRRVPTILLAETKEAVECFDQVLEHPLIDDVHIGLNDLHLSYNMTFMFELLADGTVEKLCRKCSNRGIRYGFGGIARIGEGLLPAEKIIMEHYRLGSTAAILSRSFCNADEIDDINEIDKLFCQNMKKLRDFEAALSSMSDNDFALNTLNVEQCVAKIVSSIKEKKNA